jgi:hypothetical protein
MPNLVLKTPLLVPLPATFEQYLENATKRCRYECKNAPKIDYVEVGFNVDKVEYWMRLWEKQPIKGGFPKWRRYTPQRFEALEQAGILHVFVALGSGYSELGLQLVEVCDNYAYCHPPLYDKNTNAIAKSMWFGLIRWACGKLDWLDLGGGGGQKRWNELKRDNHYKWLYVPKNIEQKPWRVRLCACGWRQLIDEQAACRGCSR